MPRSSPNSPNERIRRCTAADAPGVAAIYDPIVANTAISFEESPPGPSEMARRIVAAGERYPWLAFEQDGSLAGYAYASAHRSRAAYRWSVDVSVYVDATVRRSGIGSRLYAKLFEILAAQGFHSAFAGVTLPNDASLALHLRAGFSLVGTYHAAGFKFGAWRDTRWFERRLVASDAEPAEPRTLDDIEIDWRERR